RSIAAACFPGRPELLQEALLLLPNPLTPLKPKNEGRPFQPPCLGLRAEAPTCQGCPYSVACLEIGARVDGILLARTGTTDPLRDAKRELDRARQRRCRQRKREKAALPAANKLKCRRQDSAAEAEPSA